MKIKGQIFYVFFAFLLLLLYSNGYAQLFADIETGLAFSGYNDVRIPGDTGTEFSLSKDLEADSGFFYRLRLGFQIGSRHTISVLYAPLSLNASGQVNKPIVFFEETFAANLPLEAVYRFNSYRLTYRFDFVKKDHLKLGIGLTAKIRDAAISVESSGQTSEKTNVGFVPLINFRLEWRFAERMTFLLDGDALAAPQGRAEDVLVALQYHISEKIALRLGYRFVEGGADVDEVYNFAFINYISAGVTFQF